MNTGNCRIHEHLASSGKVKALQDPKSCCFRNSGHPGDGEKDMPAVEDCLPVIAQYCSQAAWIKEVFLKSFTSARTVHPRPTSSVSSVSTALHQIALWETSQLIFTTVVCHLRAPHWPMPLLSAPLPDLFFFSRILSSSRSMLSS